MDILYKKCELCGEYATGMVIGTWEDDESSLTHYDIGYNCTCQSYEEIE